MTRLCPKCARNLDSAWSFCPRCATPCPTEPASQTTLSQVPADVEKTPVLGAFSGLYIGVIVVPLAIILGGLLCLTGLGAFLGVPMIIFGVLAPLIGPVVGIGSLSGKCPWCGACMDSIVDGKKFECLECSHKIAIEHRHFVRAE